MILGRILMVCEMSKSKLSLLLLTALAFSGCGTGLQYAAKSYVPAPIRDPSSVAVLSNKIIPGTNPINWSALMLQAVDGISVASALRREQTVTLNPGHHEVIVELWPHRTWPVQLGFLAEPNGHYEPASRSEAPLAHVWIQERDSKKVVSAIVDVPLPRWRGPGAPAPRLPQLIELNPAWEKSANYLTPMWQRIQERWENLLISNRNLPPLGSKVTVIFTMNSDGTIAQIDNVNNESSDWGMKACVTAITQSAPFGPWTKEMKETLGAKQQVTLTFFYQ